MIPMTFLRKSSPHMRRGVSTPVIMLMVLAALLPAAAVHILCFGWGLMWNLLFCTLWASLLEAGVSVLRGRHPLSGLRDFSLQVTVWLYCLAIPPYISLWMTILGVTFAVLIVKHAFGGLGQNTFNPAMAGFIFLLISVPAAMGGWVAPSARNLEIYSPGNAFQMILMDHNDIKKNLIMSNNSRIQEEADTARAAAAADGATYATPLNRFREIFSYAGIVHYVPDLDQGWTLETHGGVILSLAYALGGIFLIVTGFISAAQPLAFLISVYASGVVVNMLGVGNNFTTISDWEHLFIGSTMCGAFFIITDPVSSPTSLRGRIISAAIIGMVTVAIRTFGSYPDAIAFAALLGNSINPLINKLTRPRRFGDTPPAAASPAAGSGTRSLT